MTTVNGVCFNDVNKNGIYELGIDQPTPNVLIEARSIGNAAVLASITSDASGNYSLTWPTQTVEVFVSATPSGASGLVTFDPVNTVATYIVPAGAASGYAPFPMRSGVLVCRA